LEGVVVPALLLPEVAAALTRGDSDLELASRSVAWLRSAAFVTIAPLDEALAARAAEIAATCRLRVSDAVYVALAERLDQPLVTLDRQQLERGASVVVTQEPSAR